MGVDANARFEPDAVLVDQTHSRHWHLKKICRHFGDTVEGRFRRRVENLVPPERIQALSLVLGDCGFHGINVRAITDSRGRRSPVVNFYDLLRTIAILRFFIVQRFSPAIPKTLCSEVLFGKRRSARKLCSWSNRPRSDRGHTSDRTHRSLQDAQRSRAFREILPRSPRADNQQTART